MGSLESILEENMMVIVLFVIVVLVLRCGNAVIYHHIPMEGDQLQKILDQYVQYVIEVWDLETCLNIWKLMILNHKL